MSFEGRDLEPDEQPVSSTELLEGAVYFAVNYVDEELLFPIIRTLVFVGRDLDPEDRGQVYFQDIESYREGVRYGDEEIHESVWFETGSENELHHIFHFDRALEALMRCSLRRKAHGV
jgi:hypothetical protein